MNDAKWVSSKKAGIFLAVVSFCVIVMLLLSVQLQPVVVRTINEKQGVWRALGDANPGAGKSGYLVFAIYPHAADPAVTYASNISNATAYEYHDAATGEMIGTTPYNTAFDFVVKYRLNVSDGYNTSAGAWTLLWSYVNMTCNFNWTADVGVTTMVDVEESHSAVYIWINAYLNNGGAGYQIAKNEKFVWNTSGFVWM